ncbi:CZB domain-containing protein [Teredinibacter sp. KSP-S5-2]|uniref:CZB domain-containing protein n=1 Tax=Teredinibacter sp. KSP-S5-2 TaxID=3034506 RepID=UPI002935114F|nr:CZB domain-containing protein [Teredinibacter sp. KSP-S5-2]WNO08659.1 CZB domain-containing protein [Teredinibacter sp. KSP-S5-2]
MMEVKEEIGKAITAHDHWKQKLRQAIDTGECESTPDRVKQDYNCSFGKWLHQRIDENQKHSEYYEAVVSIHADFHKEAGKILELALTGQKEKANALMRLGGDFSTISTKLTTLMKEWQNILP